MQEVLQMYVSENFCYLTTTGRKSGKAHTIEIWFALEGSTLYMLSGGRDKADWVKNIQHQPEVEVRIKATPMQGRGRVVAESSEEDARARQLVFSKYAPRSNEDLRDWSRRSLTVAVDIV